jgi:L-amino acid N-acyltransferase YncA
MVIRDAADGDLGAIVEIYNDTIPTRLATADLEPLAASDRVGWFARHTPQRHPCGSRRRRGIGAALLARALRSGPELGLSTLLGFIFAHNQPSIALFEGSGFERWGRLPRVAQLDEAERDLLIVGRRVPA